MREESKIDLRNNTQTDQKISRKRLQKLLKVKIFYEVEQISFQTKIKSA